MRQLSFTLLDLIQLGVILPHFNSTTKVAFPGRHEIHDHTDRLLISSYNRFDEEYHQLKLSLPELDDSTIQEARDTLYEKYKKEIVSSEVPDIVVTSDNIPDVKVFLIGPFFNQ